MSKWFDVEPIFVLIRSRCPSLAAISTPICDLGLTEEKEKIESTRRRQHAKVGLKLKYFLVGK